MVDFRSHEEKRRDQQNSERQAQQEEGDARAALRRMEPKIEDYKAEVKSLLEQVTELRSDNQALTEALKLQMRGVEEIKSFLLERMDGLSTDMDQVHRKIISMAEDDMRLVKQMSDNQNDRLAKLSTMVTGGSNG